MRDAVRRITCWLWWGHIMDSMCGCDRCNANACLRCGKAKATSRRVA